MSIQRDNLNAARASRNGAEPDPVKVTTASSVTSRNVRWAWDGWMPLGMLSLLVGQPGQGKTTFSTRLAADVTVGTLPGVLEGQPADVLLISYEDALEETLKPRVEAAGADLDRVHFLGAQQAGKVLDLTRQLSGIEAVIVEKQARLLIVDPLVAGMPAGEVNSHRDQEVRSVLAPMAQMAERCGTAVLATMHFSKAATSALLGAGGSIGFIGAARSIMVFGVDPRDKEAGHGPARILAHAKCNVGRLQQSHEVIVIPAYIDPFGDDPITTNQAVLGDECEVSADELVRVASRNASPRDKATEFLRDLLADGPHRAAEIQGFAQDDGISERTLKRAKSDLNVQAYQEGGKWWWRLPNADDEDET